MPSTMEPILYLSSQHVDVARVDMRQVIALLEQMFRMKSEKRVELPAKLGLHPALNSFLHAMPAAVSGMSAVGMKWVSAYPGNAARRLPQIAGLIVLNDPETGRVSAMMDCAWITAVRTAAASALAARYLARRDSRVVGILGCGVQGRHHVEAFLCEFGIQEILAFDISETIVDRFALDMGRAHGIRVTRVATPREAVSGSDIVLTAGPIVNPPHATIERGWLSRGSCGISIDYASYWSAPALAEIDVLCTDDIAQYRDAFAKAGRAMPMDVRELASLVSGLDPGRSREAERTFACNLGIALEDVVVARAVLERARGLGIGQELPR